MWIGFNDDGDLVFSAQDIGPDAEAFTGDSDYEFWYTIPKRHLPDFAELVGIDASQPSEGLLAKWRGDKRFGELQEIMRATSYVRFDSY